MEEQERPVPSVRPAEGQCRRLAGGPRRELEPLFGDPEHGAVANGGHPHRLGRNEEGGLILPIFDDDRRASGPDVSVPDLAEGDRAPGREPTHAAQAMRSANAAFAASRSAWVLARSAETSSRRACAFAWSFRAAALISTL